MGSWIGHIAPGVFFIFFAFWWHINNCARYIRSLVYNRDENTRQEKYEFQGSTTYPCHCIPIKFIRRLPIESIVKILVTSIHFSIELHDGYRSQPKPHIITLYVNHMAMLFGFFLSSWVEILVHYKVPLPKRINQVMGVLAFTMEGFMFLFHLHGRGIVEVHAHQLLIVSIVCSTISAIGECFDPNNFWFIVLRSFFALTQGTWFIQAAYVLFPQTTNPSFIWDDTHDSVSLLTMSYVYHLAGNVLVLIVVYLLVYLFISRTSKLNHNRIQDDEPLNGYKLIVNGNDEENGL
ncbi:unnamed protein product [Rotaria sordida]|uniref:Transmembrane protein 45B n=1 Tax=Rotaria sordida TaxID=392033 RepID=A0A815AZ00_9BILA|nr:unnamed protein product [Rotaria sordida]CAF1543247.1 unnamed protein product [Rotaria sordida]